MGTKHPNRQVLQIYTSQILIIFLMSMNIVADENVIFQAVFFLGGGGDLAEPDQQAHFDHFPPISTRIFQGTSN